MQRRELKSVDTAKTATKLSLPLMQRRELKYVSGSPSHIQMMVASHVEA